MANGLLDDTSADRPWLWLVLVLAICAAPMLVGLDPRGVLEVQVVPVPGVMRAAAAGAVTLIAIYWAGCTLGGATLGLVGAMAAGTAWPFQELTRLGAGEIELLACVSLSVASALWAMAPFAAPPRAIRRVSGWGLTAVALAGATMIDAPVAWAVTLPPVLLMIAMVGSDWRGNAVSLLLAGAGAAALAMPWLVTQHAPAHGRVGLWGGEALSLPGWAWLIGPWTLWLIGGMLLPFIRGGEGLRRRVLLPWLWLAVVGGAMLLMGLARPRDIVLLLPPAALLAGWVWAHQQRLADRGEREALAIRLAVPHWASLMLVSVAAGPVLLGQVEMVERGWLERMVIAPPRPEVVIVASVALLAIAAGGAWAHARGRPRHAALATGAWAAVLLAMGRLLAP